MAKKLKISPENSKEELYKELMPQVESILSGESDLIANFANVSAILKEAFDFFWAGFYLVKGQELVLGPFQGTLACTRIPFGKGVCGTAWKEKRTVIVPDVHQFEGHIACSCESKSEIVVPVIRNNEVIAVLDIDSDVENDFDQTDADYLERITGIIPGNPVD